MAGLFVTGASGYVGSRIIRSDLSRYDRIVCLLRGPTAKRALPDIPKLLAVHGDLTTGDCYQGALSECDTVLHLAAVTGKARREEYFRVNAEGTRSLLRACATAGVQRFLHVSTIAVRFPDQHGYYYAQSKSQGEDAVRETDLDYAIARPTIVLGQGAPVFEGLSRIARAPVMPVFGAGSTLVQPVHVDDLVDCLLGMLAARSFDHETVEVGGPDRVSIKQLLNMIRQIRYGKPPRAVHLPFGPVRQLAGFSEFLLGTAAPVTVGQLATFNNPGVANEHPLLQSRMHKMIGVERAIAMGGP